MRHYPYTTKIKQSDILELTTALDWLDAEMDEIRITEWGGYQLYFLTKEKVRLQTLLDFYKLSND